MEKFIKITLMLTGSLATALPGVSRAQGIVVGPGARMVLTGSNLHLVNNGSLVNHGTITSAVGSTVHIGGDGFHSEIGGSGTTSLHHLLIDKFVDDASLMGNINVAGNLELITGNLILDGHTLNLGTTGVIINESSANMLSGYNGGEITRQATVNAPNAFNPGNIGLEITSAANMGTVLIKRKYNTFTLSPNDQSIERYYEVTATTNTNLNARVRIHYTNEDIPGVNPSNLYVWSSNNQGALWNNLNRDGIDLVEQYVEKQGLNSLNWLTLGINNTPLPLDLLSFKARLEGINGQLTWTVAQERAVSHFEIERSADGKKFDYVVGRVNSVGDHAEPHTYTISDNSLMNGTNYYRLKMIDRDGKFTYSSVELLQLSVDNSSLLSVYPNPSSDKVYITLSNERERNLGMYIMDIAGKEVYRQQVALVKGINKVEVSLAELLDGNYFIRLDDPTISTIKIVKK
jgi:hypothetical protein